MAGLSEDKFLTITEISEIVVSLSRMKIESIGTQNWFYQCQNLIALNNQIISEWKTKYPQSDTINVIIAFEKLPVIIHAVISMFLWRKNVFPKLTERGGLKKVENMLCFLMLNQEPTVMTILLLLVSAKPTLQNLKDEVLDLIDYCAHHTACIAHLSKEKWSTFHNENEPFDGTCVRAEEENLEAVIGLVCVEILGNLAEGVGELSMSAAVRMYNTHDVPLLAAQIIEKKPWKMPNYYHVCKRSRKYSTQLTNTEAHCWFALRGLLLHPLAGQLYEITPHRKEMLLKLQKHLHETIIDQLAPLLELKHWLSRLNMSSTSCCKPPLIIETVAPIKAALLAEDEKWKKLLEANKKTIFGKNNTEYLMNVLPFLRVRVGANDVPVKQATPCGSCNKHAIKKCSKCKKVWYCSRKCQVKDWPEHKLNCISPVNPLL